MTRKYLDKYPKWIHLGKRYSGLMVSASELEAKIVGPFFSGDSLKAREAIRSVLAGFRIGPEDLPINRKVIDWFRTKCPIVMLHDQVLALAIALHREGVAIPYQGGGGVRKFEVAADCYYRVDRSVSAKLVLDLILALERKCSVGSSVLHDTFVVGSSFYHPVTNQLIEDLIWLNGFASDCHMDAGYHWESFRLAFMPDKWYASIEHRRRRERRLAMAAWIMMAGSCNRDLWEKAIVIADGILAENPDSHLDELIKMAVLPCKFFREILGLTFDFVPF